MPYEPTNWKSGDVVTSAKLNKIEGGIVSGGVLVVTDTDGTLDKTWQEIFNSVPGFIISASEDEKSFTLILNIGVDDGEYYLSGMAGERYVASSASGHPVATDSGGEL